MLGYKSAVIWPKSTERGGCPVAARTVSRQCTKCHYLPCREISLVAWAAAFPLLWCYGCPMGPGWPCTNKQLGARSPHQHPGPGPSTCPHCQSPTPFVPSNSFLPSFSTITAPKVTHRHHLPIQRRLRFRTRHCWGRSDLLLLRELLFLCTFLH